MTTRGNDRPSWNSAPGASARYISALHDVSGRIPYHHVDWDVFYRRLAARADLALAQHRRPNLVWLHRAESVIDQRPALAWWEHAARWSRAIVTASVAAGIALTMVVRASPKETTEAVVATAVGVATDAPRAAFESAVVGRSSTLSMRATMLPSATDLLIPLGAGQGR